MVAVGHSGALRKLKAIRSDSGMIDLRGRRPGVVESSETGDWRETCNYGLELIGEPVPDPTRDKERLKEIKEERSIR